jgi:hypothetical protein
MQVVFNNSPKMYQNHRNVRQQFGWSQNKSEEAMGRPSLYQRVGFWRMLGRVRNVLSISLFLSGDAFYGSKSGLVILLFFWLRVGILNEGKGRRL